MAYLWDSKCVFFRSFEDYFENKVAVYGCLAVDTWNWEVYAFKFRVYLFGSMVYLIMWGRLLKRDGWLSATK